MEHGVAFQLRGNPNMRGALCSLSALWQTEQLKSLAGKFSPSRLENSVMIYRFLLGEWVCVALVAVRPFQRGRHFRSISRSTSWHGAPAQSGKNTGFYLTILQVWRSMKRRTQRMGNVWFSSFFSCLYFLIFNFQKDINSIMFHERCGFCICLFLNDFLCLWFTTQELDVQFIQHSEIKTGVIFQTIRKLPIYVLIQQKEMPHRIQFQYCQDVWNL